jgi:ATP/maltotriose-dependent transcriptional regulator MalT
MDYRQPLTQLRQALYYSETGQHAALLTLLSGSAHEEIESSPTLALLCGIAHARLGRHAEGTRWVETALHKARERGDRAVEARALNVRGAIALESGMTDEAAEHFMKALAEAGHDGDHGTMGRASNNLGIVANLRGDYGRAVGSFTMALAAFEQAGNARGTAEARHNLARSYREQGDLPRALEAADDAVRAAVASGDLALAAQTRAGRAEVRIHGGEAAVGLREVSQALRQHRELGDVVGEAEDLRVLALALARSAQPEEAEPVLRTVAARADEHGRPLLGAEARRDLAHLLNALGRPGEARDAALAARAAFSRLGAAAEVRKLDDLVTEHLPVR